MNKPKINLLTVCTQAYPMIYAEKLIKRFLSVTQLDVTPYCITDRPEQINGWATALPADPDSHGWWNKMSLYGPNMPQGWNVYLDLDMVIVHGFDEEILWAIRSNKRMSCISDAQNWMGVKFNSSLMIFKSGDFLDIYSQYQEQKHLLQSKAGGDQVWMGPMLDDVGYLDEWFPNLKKSLKFHLAFIDGNEIKLPVDIDKSIKLIDCSGRPKPHELSKFSYISDNWHAIQL